MKFDFTKNIHYLCNGFATGLTDFHLLKNHSSNNWKPDERRNQNA